tara:strand:+ start:1313 stop:2569 length:1257 start_codon:yes stop_codon:yes gene_type:complete
MTTRTYYDPLYSSITLNTNKPEELMVMELIDSAPFQRLRRIKQLGPASLTFHGAESSRFTHSLGVFHLARKAINQLEKIDPSINKFRGILYASALLHDIGHGPLSHSSEEMFGIKHEKWTAKIIKGHTEIRKPIENYERGTSEKVAKLIELKSFTNNSILALISSQLDCDRLDYLLRDSYTTGIGYGQIDLERIISALTIAPDGDIAIHPKGLLAVEHYLVIRNLMYRSVYNHRLNEVSNWLLEKIIKVAQQLGSDRVWADEYMKEWLWNTDQMTLDSFLANDDTLTGYHLFKWQKEGPKPLAQLCERYLQRKLLKALDIGYLSCEYQIQLLAIARKLTERKGEDPNLSCGLKRQKLHGYHPYKGGLRLWDGQNLKALEKQSSLVESLITPEESSWLIYPKGIDSDLKMNIDILLKEV